MDADKAETRKFDRTLNSFRWVLLGAWLLLLFYVNITIVVMSLSSHQILHKINATEVNGQSVSVSRMREYTRDMETIEAPKDAAMGRVNEHKKQVQLKNREFDTREAALKKTLNQSYQVALEDYNAEKEKFNAEQSRKRAAFDIRKQDIADPSLEKRKAALDDKEAKIQSEWDALKERDENLKSRRNEFKGVITRGNRNIQSMLDADEARLRADILELKAEEDELESERIRLSKDSQARAERARELNEDITQYQEDTQIRDTSLKNPILDRIEALKEERKRYNQTARCTEITLANMYHKEADRFRLRHNDLIIQYGFVAGGPKAIEETVARLRDENPVLDRTKKSAPQTDSGGCPESYVDPGVPENLIMVDDKVQGIIEDFDYFSSFQLTEDEKLYLRGPFKWLRLWKSAGFIKMPTEYLTILLVLSMGMLGGSIRLTRIYLRNEDNENYANYFFFPLMGAVTAFAVYVLAKAGVLIISDTGTGSGALSPYFISFIGLVSGMLADNALDTIQNLGGNWFREPPAGPERWALCLDEKCRGVHEVLSVEEMADLTGFMPETAQAWLDEVKPVPYDAQKLISARLNTPIRELFTDIPPRRMAADSMGSAEPDALAT